ncbi:MAG: hypothetical protein AUJ92_07550 [Armatimonadetes bacterium CG2_30_59_28]|nr:hypothetical protein [Armatimonadota bacterium]OIO95706.1 MAG: hypothetical protein AUJ92_07550 [Armatimonadetes bacterium CG2_30_59_28]PIU65553.1 MAG: hypothetical protein COS85_08325 [Armatimonadetes bacterium CG07_land_8_20_14_0_80_59_28]PIX40442.1 MAG: hypothetical protein COZ56_14685 [Armatimonadetes bacterium CG_4_8_14_3_um_filter_58_9]PIY46414.1 MAG: hypothetical protein COZ05_05780 [Armatimonadetes bacterium CG_4_10_14_3_um_filter_59_10]PJB78606.1 MAG: hypothetical protein CO095_003
MKPDPIIEELWQIKDRLAMESGYDARRFMEMLRVWEVEHPHLGPVMHSPETLGQQAAAKVRQHTESSAFVLRDKSD